MRRALRIVILIGLCGNISEIYAETLVMREGILFPRRGFPGPAYTQILRRQVALRNGKPVETDELAPGGFRELRVNPDTAMIEGATKASTVSEFGDVLRELRDASPENSPAFVNRILRANGLPNQSGPALGFGAPALADIGGSIAGKGIRAPHGKGDVQGATPGRSLAIESLLDGKGNVSRRACQNLGDAICLGNDGGDIDRAATSEQQRLDKEFLNSVPGLNAEAWKAEISGMLDLAGRISKGEAPRSSFKASPNFEKYIGFLRERLPVSGFVAGFKADALAAVRAQPISLGQKMAMEKQIGRLEIDIGPDLSDMNSVVNFLATCGLNSPGGLSEVGSNRVVLCPFLVASAGGNRDRLSLVALHEIFHQLGGNDSEKEDPLQASFKENFDDLTACFASKSAEMNKKREAEAIADHGAVEAIALGLGTLTGARALERLRTIAQPFCRRDPPSSTNSGAHPPFFERRRMILGENERILQRVCGAQAASQVAACTLQGPVGGVGI